MNNDSYILSHRRRYDCQFLQLVEAILGAARVDAFRCALADNASYTVDNKRIRVDFNGQPWGLVQVHVYLPHKRLGLTVMLTPSYGKPWCERARIGQVHC